MGNMEINNLVYNRITLFGEMPPLKVSLADRFIDEKKGRIAYNIPLYVSSSSRHRQDSTYLRDYEIISDNYIKRAFWLAYELSAHAGLETLSDFYLTVDTEMRERLEPYRKCCGFPESHIITVPDVHSVYIDYMPKIVMLTALALQTDYDYYVHLDTAMCFPVESQFCLYFKENWEEYPETFVIDKPWLPVQDFGDHFKSKNVLSLHVHHAYRSRFISEIPRFFGEESYDYYLRRVLESPLKCAGHFYGIPRNQILSENWRAFLDFIAETQCITLDEMFLTLYWHKYLSPDKRLYRHIDSFSESTRLGINDMQDPPHFEPEMFYQIYRGFKPTEAFHNFFVQHYQNLNNKS